MIILKASLLAPDWGLLIWTVIVFIILWTFLGKVAFKPIAKALKERDNSIDEALKTADNARKEMENLKSENEKLLHQAREERSNILKEAKEIKDKIVADAKDQARNEAAKIADANWLDIENQKVAAINEIKLVAGELALDMAEKVIKKELKGQSNQEAYIQKLIDEIKLN
jgi:F-type H+-transporting ATPase subunit b